MPTNDDELIQNAKAVFHGKVEHSEDVTFGKNAEVNGQLTINSATNIKDKSLTSADAGKVLTVNNNGTPTWDKASGVPELNKGYNWQVLTPDGTGGSNKVPGAKWNNLYLCCKERNWYAGYTYLYDKRLFNRDFHVGDTLEYYIRLSPSTLSVDYPGMPVQYFTSNNLIELTGTSVLPTELKVNDVVYGTIFYDLEKSNHASNPNGECGKLPDYRGNILHYNDYQKLVSNYTLLVVKITFTKDMPIGTVTEDKGSYNYELTGKWIYWEKYE